MNVDPALFAAFRRLDTLAIQNACTRLRLTPMLDTHFLDQGYIDPFPDAIFLPPPKVAVDCLPGWQVRWQHAPLATGADNIQDRIEDLPHFPFARASALMSRNEVHDQ
jgi:hypothetical protein